MATKKADTKQPEAPKGPDESAVQELAGKSIDQRMADLLKDHKKMGAR